MRRKIKIPYDLFEIPFRICSFGWGCILFLCLYKLKLQIEFHYVMLGVYIVPLGIMILGFITAKGLELILEAIIYFVETCYQDFDLDSPFFRQPPPSSQLDTPALPQKRRSYSRNPKRSTSSQISTTSSVKISVVSPQQSTDSVFSENTLPDSKSKEPKSAQTIVSNTYQPTKISSPQINDKQIEESKFPINSTHITLPNLGTPSTQLPIYPIITNDILGIENELVQENSPSEINIDSLVEEIITPSIHKPANHKVISDFDVTTRLASPEIEVVLLHNQMQRQIHYCLTISNNRERSVIAEMGGIDILIVDPNLSTLIEIKTSTDIIFNIRQAVGQLLEYEFFNREKIPGYKVQLMIVSPAELNDEAKEYLTHLRLVYDLDFKYLQYVPDSLIFTI